MKSKCIIILGMHRSGSSLVARIFHEWGVNLGDDLMKGDGANPEGFYEDWDFVHLNNTLLSGVDADWSNPKIVNCVNEEAGELINRKKRTLWGIKDNRFAFTIFAYPFIDKNVDVMLVVCKRKKEAVVQSLFRTHAMLFQEHERTETHFGNLYDLYYEAIAKATEVYPSIVVTYEDLRSQNVQFFNQALSHF